MEEAKLRHSLEVEQLAQLKKEEVAQAEEISRRQAIEVDHLKTDQITLLNRQKDLEEQLLISQ